MIITIITSERMRLLINERLEPSDRIGILQSRMLTPRIRRMYRSFYPDSSIGKWHDRAVTAIFVGALGFMSPIFVSIALRKH